MIRKCVKQGFFTEALQIYSSMVRSGVHGSEFTFPFVLKACAKLPSLEDATKLHSHILLTGFQAHVFVQTALVDVYSKCCCFHSARLVFDQMPIKSLVSWNSIISAHCRDFHIDQSFGILKQMQLLGLELSSATFTGFLASCSLPQGLSIHGYITKLGLDLHLPLANSIMSMYIRLNQIDGALSVFDTLHQKSIVSWTIILGGYLSAGDVAKVFAVFNQMRCQCVGPDSIVFVNLISCCKLSGNLLLAMLVHSLLLKSGFDHKDPIDNLLVAMYAKCKDLVSARRVFDAVHEKSVFLWTSMISGYAQFGYPNEALHLFNMLLRTASRPNELTLATVLSACAEMGSLRMGEEIEQYILLNGLGSDLRVQTSLIHMFCKCGSIKKAQALFERIPNKDLAVWSAMINGYAVHGMGKEALNLFHKMQNEVGIKPDAIVYTSVLLACSHSGLIEDGLKYFRSMQKDFGIEPSIQHYSCLVDLLGRAGYVELALRTIQEMPVLVQARVWAPFLSACYTHHNLELGEFAAKNLFDLEPRSTGNFVLMTNLYTSMGKWKEAAKARSIIDARGLVKEPGWSQIEIDGAVHVLAAEGQSHLESIDIHEVEAS